MVDRLKRYGVKFASVKKLSQRALWQIFPLSPISRLTLLPSASLSLPLYQRSVGWNGFYAALALGGSGAGIDYGVSPIHRG
jgi:hypothetical protein